MKIVIASLQVSKSGSKGHLHPAIELALEAKRRGHKPYLLPLPSPLGEEDVAQVKRAGIEYILSPPLPSGVIKPPGELAKFAANKEDVWKAYHSFMVAPLMFQYSRVRSILEELRPDVLVYDLLVYSAPLAARSYNIPDIGFCSGLKLIAPEEFQKIYRDVSRKLEVELSAFLKSIDAKPKFSHLELLSSHAQFVFSTDLMIKRSDNFPVQTHLVGPIHYSINRGDIADFGYLQPKEKFAVLSFGSVLDPADFPEITAAIVKTTDEVGLKLIVSSRKWKTTESHVVVNPYLSIPELLPHAQVFFHHGGANSFSEGILFATPQILIPLTTDQPIQGFFLRESKAGFSLSPSEVSAANLKFFLERLLNKNDVIHTRICEMSHDYQSKCGQKRSFEIIEEIVADRRA